MRRKFLLMTFLTLLFTAMGTSVLRAQGNVAKVGDTEYAKLADAVNAAQADDEIKVIANIATNLDLTISKKVTLDLGGFTLSDAGIIIASDVTIKNGEIVNTNEPYPLKVTGSGNLTVEDVDIEASKSDRAIWLAGSSSVLNFKSGSSILATKGTNNTKSNIYGVWVAEGATANIYGGTITVDAGANATAVAIFGNYDNTVNIYGGKISISGKNYSYAVYVYGDVTITGGEIVTNEKQYGYSSGITYGYNYAINSKGNVEISGDTKITTYGPKGYIVNAGGSNQEVVITGGEFTNVLSEADMIAGGHHAPYLIYGSSVAATIAGGDFNGYGYDDNGDNAVELIKGTGSTLTITGGSFDNKPKDDYVEVGATITVGETTYTKTEDGLEVVIPVASVNGTSYTDLQEAIKAAAPSGTVEILSDVTVDEWIMFSETLNIGSGQIITMNINGLTINGNDKTVTINSIESAGNGGYLIFDATNLNVKDLTIKYAEGLVGGIGLKSGTINKVTIEGGAGVFPGTGNITISECNFKTSGHCIYFEEERDNLVVTKNTFELPADANVILLRGDVKFTDNIVVSGRTVNVVSGSPEVTGNNFNGVRFKVYNAATATIENNEINVLAFNDDSVVCSTFDKNTLSEEAQAVLDAASFPVAQIGTTKYAKLEDAFKAATSGSVIEILSDVTVDYAWDCRNTGSKFTVPVTINGNDKTIKFTGAIDDKNWNTVFRFEEEATVNNLTVNIEGATTVQRVITAKKSLNVDDLTIVGSSKYGIIFGEGASAEDLAATEIVIKNSALNGTRRAVSDNEGGKDVKSVVIEGNNLTANVYVSASESIVFNNNTTTSEVDLRSYAADNILSVEAKDNELNEEVKNYIYAKNIDAQEEFTTENPPLKVANKAELNAAIAAAKEGNVITLTADIDYGTDQLKIEKAITLDLGGKTLTTRNAYGGMSIKNNPTIKNGNIVHASNTAAIKVWNATAFEDLVIDVQGKGDANKTIGGIVLQEGSTTCVGSIKNVTIKGEALTNGIETYNCGNATDNVIGSMENVVINAVGTAMKISAPCGTATDCSFNGGDTGIELWIKGTYSASLDLVECEVSGGKKSVYIHDEFNSNPVVNTGDLKLTADNATTFESESGAPIALTIAHTEGEIDYTLIDKLIETTVAKVNDVYYTTLQAAINVAQTGDVVKVFEGEYSVPSMKAGITIEGVVEGEGEVLFKGTLSGTLENLTLKNIHIKDANAQRWAYAKGNLVFENVIFEATSVYAIHFDGITEGTNLHYKNCTIIGWAAMGGSPASCKFEGCTIKDNGTYGVIRTYFDATIEECTFDIANVNTTDIYQDGIHAVSGANVIVKDCTNENGDMIDVINVGDTSVVVLDGVEIKNIVKVAKKDENPKYYRTLPEAFAALGDGSNTTVTLLADVDLDGAEWTPVNFNGVFDGQDHTISNLTITGYNSNVGFFGQTNNGEIKNLTIKNANVSGRLNVGVVAGTPYTSKYTNIKVTGHVEVNGMAYVGGVGGKNAYANWTDITVDVDETSYVKANSVEDGTAYRTYVGGVIGFNGEGSHTFKNITSNIKVIGSTCDIGGIFGIAHYGNNFENIEHSGSVINETNDATDALETGLIAGVWHNAKGTSVTFTNATSTGTISAPNAGVTFPENSLVGAAYTPSNETSGTSGSLVINGETVYPYVAKIGDAGYNTLAKAVTAAQDGETIQLLWAQGDAPIAMNASLYGKNVTIKGTATVDWSNGFLFVGRGGVGNATLTFNGANLTSASDNASTGIHVSGREKGTDNKYDGTLVINNSTIELDYLINKGTMTLDNSTLTVKNGFSVGGRPASETESGQDATATITLNNGSKVVVNRHNGMGLGYEAIGVMNVNSGSTFETTEDFLITANGTMNVNGGNVKTVGTLTNNGTINVTGESTLNIEKLEGSSIDLMDGAIVKNSTVGGNAYIAGNVIFRGDNTFNMITDYGDYYSQETPSMWTVEAGASLKLTKTDRYGLGYGDKVTVYGEIEDEGALTARASLTDEDASVNMYGGLVGMTNSAATNAENSFTATNAYLIFGVNGDKSFGNKPGNYYGNYTFTFNNSVVTANGFKFYEDNGTSTVKFSDSDLLVNGVLMTNDASSSFTFENSVVLSEAQNNGTNDKNQNAGVMTLSNTQFTYSAAFTNVGTLNLDLSSKLTAPSVAGDGIINIDATDFNGNDIHVISADMASFNGIINVEGAHYIKKNDGIYVTNTLQGTLTKAYTSATGYWGECGGNANESFVLKFYNDDTYMGQTSLNDTDNIIDGDVYVTWSIDLNIDPNAEGYWDMSWDIRPTLAMQPNRVEQWIDGVKVAECAVEPNWADNIFPVVAAVTDENDVILSYVNNTTGATLKDAFAAGGNVTILRDFNLSETVTVPTDKTVVLDLNGKAIAMTNNIITTTYAINNLGTLTIEDSSTDKTGSVSARGIYNGYDADGNNVATAKITIEGGTFNAQGENGGAAVCNYGIADIKGGKFTSVGSYSLNNQSGASMTIADGVEATGGIYNSGATLTVNGGKISNSRSGAHTIYSWDSNVTLKDGEIHNENSNNATIFADGTSEVNIVDGTFTIKVVDESSSYLIDTDSKLNISGGEFTGGIRVQANGNMSITEGTYHNNHGNYNVYEGGSLVISGGTFCENAKTFVEDNLAQGYALKELANGYYTVIQVAGTQTTELITGWNWFSTYIKQGNDGLSLLQNALDPYGVEIKNREGFTRYYHGLNDWSPSQTLTSVSTTKMYMIKTSAAHTLELKGSFEDENVEITIAPGWNWIGYPVHEEGISFEDALSNIEPAHGDIIKSQSLYAQYIDMFGTAGWAVENGESLIMNPGEGYKYYSNKSQVFRFTYSTEVNSKRETSIETIDNYWLTDANQYSGNMTMLAMLSVDGEIVKGNYEVAAFANGECRGSARPIYIEALDAYVLLMTIHGEEVEELTFKYYDVNYGTEYELNNRINYSDDAIVGSFEEPYMFNLGILNIDETSVENISIYPNPTTTGKEINLQAVCDKVEVFNALGVKVAEYTNVDSIDAIETAGIYVIRVTIDGNARNCRLIVK